MIESHVDLVTNSESNFKTWLQMMKSIRYATLSKITFGHMLEIMFITNFADHDLRIRCYSLFLDTFVKSSDSIELEIICCNIGQCVDVNTIIELNGLLMPNLFLNLPSFIKDSFKDILIAHHDFDYIEPYLNQLFHVLYDYDAHEEIEYLFIALKKLVENGSQHLAKIWDKMS